MSQEDVELAQRASVALNNALKAGDLRPFLDQFCDPQIVFKPAGILPETAEMHGRTGLGPCTVVGAFQRAERGEER
jgi:hypothetical protein